MIFVSIYDKYDICICRYVGKSRIVRMGGRSRDVEMEEISLKSLARNDDFTVNSHGRKKKKERKNDDMKFEIFSELDKGRVNIKENFIKIMNYHHHITYDQIFEAFTLEQIRFLIYNFQYRNGSFTIKNAHENKDERVTHESVQSLKLENKDVRNSTFVRQIKDVIIGCWLPRKSQFDEFEANIMKSVIVKKQV